VNPTYGEFNVPIAGKGVALIVGGGGSEINTL
jgi:hypothetical protein